MKRHTQIMIVFSGVLVAALAGALTAAESKADKGKVRDGAFYEFRGHISDRNTLEKTFTLGWDEGSQVIAIAPETKIFRHGRAANLDDAKSGDAVHGYGRVQKGKLVAFALAFGDEGVELPRSVRVPDSITLPP